MKNETIPNFKRRNKSAGNNYETESLLDLCDNFVGNLDFCSRIEKLENNVSEIQGIMEVRAWIDRARQLITKELETRFSAKFASIQQRKRLQLNCNPSDPVALYLLGAIG